jgi:glycosyltransferase involved in cell wall biosynthesis
MHAARHLKIALVSPFYSEGMGYSENCLPKALACLGHDVHVITSTYNVYGNEALYDQTYAKFLGPRQRPVGSMVVDGYQVHRLPPRELSRYIRLKGLAPKIRSLQPDVVHSLEIASLLTFDLAARKPFARYKLFCETHHHLSVVRPYVTGARQDRLRKAAYWLTRTLPTRVASQAVEKCYAVAADCVEVATRFFGVPASKVVLLRLGTDTETFHPAGSDDEHTDRASLRAKLGFEEDDIVCVYTGRFSEDKNPLLLARAIAVLNRLDPRFKGLFIGDGSQKESIGATPSCTVISFMAHADLSRHYRAVDLAVWPREESMSMLDAAASGLPLIVSGRIGEPERVAGNGRLYEENSVESLADALRSFASGDERRRAGVAGRRKMVDEFSWMRFARVVEADYFNSLSARGRRPAVSSQDYPPTR